MRERGKRMTKAATTPGTAIKSKKEEVTKAKGTADDFLASLDKTETPENIKNDFITHWEREVERNRSRLICQCGESYCTIGPMTRMSY